MAEHLLDLFWVCVSFEIFPSLQIYNPHNQVAVYFTCKWDADHDDDDAQDDGDDAEQTSQATQPPGPVDVAALQAVSGLETQRQQRYRLLT